MFRGFKDDKDLEESFKIIVLSLVDRDRLGEKRMLG